MFCLCLRTANRHGKVQQTGRRACRVVQLADVTSAFRNSNVRKKSIRCYPCQRAFDCVCVSLLFSCDLRNCKLLVSFWVGFHLPIVGYLIAQAIAYVAIQQIVANVGRRAFHPFYRNGSFGDVEIVLQEFRRIRGRFPVKLLCYARPKLRGIVQGLLIEFRVLIKTGYVRVTANCRIRIEYWFFRWHFASR